MLSKGALKRRYKERENCQLARRQLFTGIHFCCDTVIYTKNHSFDRSPFLAEPPQKGIFCYANEVTFRRPLETLGVAGCLGTNHRIRELKFIDLPARLQPPPKLQGREKGGTGD